MNNLKLNFENIPDEINKMKLIKKRIELISIVRHAKKEKEHIENSSQCMQLNLVAQSNTITIENIRIIMQVLAEQMVDPTSIFPGSNATGIPVLPDEEREIVLQKLMEQINRLK